MKKQRIKRVCADTIPRNRLHCAINLSAHTPRLTSLETSIQYSLPDKPVATPFVLIGSPPWLMI